MNRKLENLKKQTLELLRDFRISISGKIDKNLEEQLKKMQLKQQLITICIDLDGYRIANLKM